MPSKQQPTTSKIKKNKILEITPKFAEREGQISKDQYRDDFQRDRDRILYSTAFRRLNGKTQVFLPHARDHVRNRLTHTLEVTQIARTTVRQLGLNEDLVEAIALAHDLGHTPFGHVGERSLNHIMNNCGLVKAGDFKLPNEQMGFKHNWQGVRVCTDLESSYDGQHALNLTNYTLWGILNHSSLYWHTKPCPYQHEKACLISPALHNCHCHPSEKQKSGLSVDFYSTYQQAVSKRCTNEAWSFEGYVVEFADEIAQRHHDLEDAIRTNILTVDDIIEKINSTFLQLFDKEDKHNLRQLQSSWKNKDGMEAARLSTLVVKLYNKNLIETSKQRMLQFSKDNNIYSKKDFYYNHSSLPKYDNVIGFSESMVKADKEFSNFLKSTILDSFWVQRMDGKGGYLIRKLFKAYLSNPRQLHNRSIEKIFKMYPEHNHISFQNNSEQLKISTMRNKIGDASLRTNDKFVTALYRGICDHISGMTDDFVLREYEKLYGDSPL